MAAVPRCSPARASKHGGVFTIPENCRRASLLSFFCFGEKVEVTLHGPRQLCERHKVFFLTLVSRANHWPNRVQLQLPCLSWLLYGHLLIEALDYRSIFLTVRPILAFFLLQVGSGWRRPGWWRACLTVGYWSNPLTLEDWILLEGSGMNSWLLYLWNDEVGTRDVLGFL